MFDRSRVATLLSVTDNRSRSLAHMQDLDLIQFFSDLLTYAFYKPNNLVPHGLCKMLGFHVITACEMLNR